MNALYMIYNILHSLPFLAVDIIVDFRWSILHILSLGIIFQDYHTKGRKIYIVHMLSFLGREFDYSLHRVTCRWCLG